MFESKSWLKSKPTRSAFQENRAFLKRYPQYQIGRASYGCPEVFSWGADERLQIGSFCSISDQVNIFLGGEHRTDWITTFPFSSFLQEAEHIPGHPKSKGDVWIGNDVWIAFGATILSGVRIGNGAVIGANAVVSKNVPPYAIVAGNPATIIKYRFTEDIIDRLQAIAWWDWPEDAIRTHIPYLLSNDLESFFQQAEQVHIRRGK